MAAWRNWSGSVVGAPTAVERPRSADASSALVVQTERVRVTRAGHSFMPLCETAGLLFNLNAYLWELFAFSL